MLRDYSDRIKPVDRVAMKAAQTRLDSIAKPIGSLGRLEEALVAISGMIGDDRISLDKKALVIMCADNGVVEEGISQSGQEVTAVVSKNFTEGKASVNQFAAVAGVDVFPVDIGINADMSGTRILHHKVRWGTGNLLKGRAMSPEEVVQAIEVGIQMVAQLKDQGYKIIATGEMGIGNTTTTSAMTAALFDMPVKMVTGKGAGLSDLGVIRKVQVIEEALAFHQWDGQDPLELLSRVGGLDIAGMAGLFLGGAIHGIPIVIDGIISGISAVIATAIAPEARHYMLASHISKEPAGVKIVDHLDLKPLLICDMGLGEGTGAVGIMPLLDMVLGVYNHMPTFDDLAMEAYEDYDNIK